MATIFVRRHTARDLSEARASSKGPDGNEALPDSRASDTKLIDAVRATEVAGGARFARPINRRLFRRVVRWAQGIRLGNRTTSERRTR